MSDPPPNPSPQPFILDYQRVEKAKRNATGGLFLMGLGITIFGAVPIICSVWLRDTMDISLLFTVLLIFAWGVCYMVCAGMMRKDSLPATLVALIVTSLQALGMFGLVIFAISPVFADPKMILDFGPAECLLGAILSCFVLASVGVVIEVWTVYRSLRFWRKNS